MQTGEGHHVDGQFPQVSVQLSGESEAGGHSRHGGGHQMVQISVCGCGQFQGSEKIKSQHWGMLSLYYKDIILLSVLQIIYRFTIRNILFKKIISCIERLTI